MQEKDISDQEYNLGSSHAILPLLDKVILYLNATDLKKSWRPNIFIFKESKKITPAIAFFFFFGGRAPRQIFLKLGLGTHMQEILLAIFSVT